MIQDIFKKIEERIGIISDEDINTWIIGELMISYNNRIRFFAKKAYGTYSSTSGVSTTPDVAIKAFVEMAKISLKGALHTFIIKKEHWKQNRNLNSYLLKTISNLSGTITTQNNARQKVVKPICPACKYFGHREILVQESSLLRCSHCSSEETRLASEIKNINSLDLQQEYKLRKMFSLHSKKGFKCPECNRFIPISAKTSSVITCPYKNCLFSGPAENLQQVSHPSGSVFLYNISLSPGEQPFIHNFYRFGNGSNSEKLLLNSSAAITSEPTAEDELNALEQYNDEKEILLSVIDEQKKTIKRLNYQGTVIQKTLMYQAYTNMIEKFPEEMVSYLVHRKQQAEFPVQPKIFQEYVRLIENHLPFSVKKGGRTVDICSLTDPNLSLFLGKSIYEAEVIDGLAIPNKTKEVYIGGIKHRNYGPCFIGRLIDVKNKDTNESLLKHVKQHSFIQIFMDNHIPIGTQVVVSHFRIPSHYEMDSMVFLQKIRRNIVDSVYFKMHKKKRIALQNHV